MHTPFEGGAEGAVTVVAALLSQLLVDNGLMGSGTLSVACYEVTDAKVVDVFVVTCVLTGEILAEIIAVHADGSRELRQCQITCGIHGFGFADVNRRKCPQNQ